MAEPELSLEDVVRDEGPVDESLGPALLAEVERLEAADTTRTIADTIPSTDEAQEGPTRRAKYTAAIRGAAGKIRLPKRSSRPNRSGPNPVLTYLKGKWGSTTWLAIENTDPSEIPHAARTHGGNIANATYQFGRAIGAMATDAIKYGLPVAAAIYFLT